MEIDYKSVLKECPTGVYNREELYQYCVELYEYHALHKDLFPLITVSSDGQELVKIETPMGVIFSPADIRLERIRALYFEAFSDPQINMHSFQMFPIGVGDIVVDAGAYEGFYTLHALNCGANVIAFEPMESMGKCLIKTFENNNGFTLISKGLGAYDGEVSFYEHDTSSSYIVMPTVPDSKMIKSPIVTLDSVVKDLKLSRVDHIKMDIEGMEFQAIFGAAETIRKYKPFLTIMTYHYYSCAYEIYRFLQLLCPEYKVCLWGKCLKNTTGLEKDKDFRIHTLYAYVDK